MALKITNIRTTTTSISFIADSVPQEYYKQWEYRVGTIRWVTINNAESYRYNVTISGLTENTKYKIGIRARKSSDNSFYYSLIETITTAKSTAPPTVTTSVTEIKNNSCKIKAASNYYGKNWQYSLNSGSTWTTFPSNTSGVLNVTDVISGLTPATQYKIRTRCTRTYNNVTGTSGTKTITTTGVSLLNSVNAVIADATTPQVTFNWTVAAGTGFTHTLYIKASNGTTIVTVSGLTGTSGSKTITLTNAQRTALLNQLGNAQAYTATFELKTLNGSTQIGTISSTTALIRTTEKNSKPTFTDWSIVEQNANVSGVTSEVIKMISNIQINCNAATAKNGASIARYGIALGSRVETSTTTTIDYGICYECGLGIPWTVWAEDTRGYRTEIVKNIDIWCYEKPEIIEWETQREDSVGAKTALYFLSTVRTTQTNNLNAAWYRTKKGTASWTAWTLLPSGAFTYVGAITPGRGGFIYDESNWANLDPESSYQVQLKVRDKFQEESTPVTLSVRRGIPLMSLRDARVGINTANPRAALDIIDEEFGGFYINDNFLSGGVHSYGDNSYGKWVTFTTGITIQVYYKQCTQDDFTILNSASGLSGATLRSQLQNFDFPIAVNRTFHVDFSIGGGSVVAWRSRPILGKFGYGTTAGLSTSQWQNLALWHWDTFGSTFDVHIGFFTIGWRNIA